jgi:hypothetical protein
LHKAGFSIREIPCFAISDLAALLHGSLSWRILSFFVSIFATVFHNASGPHISNGPPPVFFFFFPFFWLFAMFGWVANVILGIMYGIKANHGEWAGYPIIGKWCLAKAARVAPTQAQPSAT